MFNAQNSKREADLQAAYLIIDGTRLGFHMKGGGNQPLPRVQALQLLCEQALRCRRSAGISETNACQQLRCAHVIPDYQGFAICSSIVVLDGVDLKRWHSTVIRA